MDIDSITDVKELKALSYDQQLVLERAQQNLRLLRLRIAQLEHAPEAPKPVASPDPKPEE